MAPWLTKEPMKTDDICLFLLQDIYFIDEAKNKKNLFFYMMEWWDGTRNFYTYLDSIGDKVRHYFIIIIIIIIWAIVWSWFFYCLDTAQTSLHIAFIATVCKLEWTRLFHNDKIKNIFENTVNYTGII